MNLKAIEVNKISEKLKQSPKEGFEFDDDGQIKEFLVELGLSSQFKKNPSREHKETIQAITELNHPTHYLLIRLWAGYDDPKQNGYQIVAVPKLHVTPERFMEGCRMALGDRPVIDSQSFRGQQVFPSN